MMANIPDNSPLVGQRWATSGKSVGPSEAATGGPPSFCPLGQWWQNLPTIHRCATGGMLPGMN